MSLPPPPPREASLSHPHRSLAPSTLSGGRAAPATRPTRGAPWSRRSSVNTMEKRPAGTAARGSGVSALCSRVLGSGLQPPGNFSWALRPQGQTITTLPQAATQQGYHLVPQEACLHPSTVAPVHYQHLIAFGFSVALSHLLLQRKKPGSSLGA